MRVRFVPAPGCAKARPVDQVDRRLHGRRPPDQCAPFGAGIDARGPDRLWNTFRYVVTLVRTDNGQVLAQAERCDVCTESEATGNALLATIKLMNAIPNQLPDRGRRAGRRCRGRSQRRRANDAPPTAGVPGGSDWYSLLVGLLLQVPARFLYLGRDDRPHLGLALGASGGGLAVGGLTVPGLLSETPK